LTTLSSRLALCAACLALLTACTTVAPQYQPVPANIARLREAGFQPVKIGAFTAADPALANMLNHPTIRGGPYLSPYQDSYVEYLRQALISEMKERCSARTNMGCFPSVVATLPGPTS